MAYPESETARKLWSIWGEREHNTIFRSAGRPAVEKERARANPPGVITHRRAYAKTSPATSTEKSYWSQID